MTEFKSYKSKRKRKKDTLCIRKVCTYLYLNLPAEQLHEHAERKTNAMLL